MNYCDVCGFSLDEPALRVGRCPNCGAPIGSPRSDAADQADIPTNPAAAALVNVSDHSPTYVAPAQFEAVDTDHRSTGSRRRRRQRRVARMWQSALLAIVLVLVAAMAVYALTQRNPVSIVVAPFTSSNANASLNSSNAGSSTATTAATSHPPTATARTAGTQHGSGGGSSSPPPPPPTTQPTPVPPTLSVSPMTFSFTACLAINNKPQFTVANTGGTPMTWSASAGGSGYTVTPSSGSIAPGAQETVTVSTILSSGTVTITAPNVHNSPQQVHITCTL